MQVKLYSVLLIHKSYMFGFLELHLRNNMSRYLTDFKKNNCMAVKDIFHPQSHGVVLEAVLGRARSWTSVVLVGPFQLRIFCD